MLYRIAFFVLTLLAAQAGSAATVTLRLNDPTDRIVVNHDNALNPSSAISIEAWVRPTALDCDTFVGKDFNAGYWFGYCGGGLRYYYANGTSVTSAASLPLSEWSHVAVTFNGSTVRFYLNGEALGVFSRSAALPADNSPLGIGGEGSSTSFPSGLFPFEGWMSEVRIWSTVRTTDQIRDNLYRQLVNDEPGLVAVWSLEGGADDRFDQFTSTPSEFATFSSLDSPAIPHEPVIIRPTTTSGVNGVCTAGDYSTSTRVPQWYDSEDLAFGERNPQEVIIGATGVYIFVCLPNRAQLPDPIWSVEIDTDNDAGALDSNDWQFRLWPSQSPQLTSRRGAVGGPPLFLSFWQPVSNPAGLLASQEPGAEFSGDMEWRIPRSIFPDPFATFRIRVSHNYLDGGTDRTVTWPPGSGSGSPNGWEQVDIDLTPLGPPDYRNPEVRTRMDDDRPTTEGVEIEVLASDDVDIELVELMVDGVVVDFREYLNATDRSVSFTHTASYPVGTHSYQARAFDHTGREVLSLYKSFRVIVDGEPPMVNLRYGPPDPTPGQTVVMVATATDPSGVSTIWIRDILGTTSPSFQRCDFSGTNETESCIWSITPPSSLLRLRLDAQAEDSEGYLADTSDYIVLFGNAGVDSDRDGLANTVEHRLCTDPFDPDTDRDGLGDGWEVQGIRFADGGLEPLVDYGVNPCWRNVLFQMDYEEGLQPPAVTFENLRNRYRENGISVYLELNERPRPSAYPQSHIGALEAAYQTEDGEYYFAPRRNWAFYYGYERGLQGRSGAWPRFFTMDHFSGTSTIDGGAGGYCSGGDEPGKTCVGDFNCPGTGASCETGCIGGDRDKLSCSSPRDCPDGDGGFLRCAIPCVTAPGASGVRCGLIGDIPTRLMHELGHAVGLGHGGNTGPRTASADRGFVRFNFAWDNENYKTNHQSIMNYGQWGGAMCVEPFPGTLPTDFRPTIVGQINYANLNQGNLNESALSESFNSQFAQRLRSRDCSLASATAQPIVVYSCTIGGDAYDVWSDGTRTLARRPKDGSWDYDPPSHSPGIDWNCNGVIDGTVNVDINGGGIDTSMLTRDEFDNIPNPVSCQDMYSAKCEDRAASCYVFPPAYRQAMGPLASGLDRVDCRAQWLAVRESSDNPACRGGSDNEFGTGTCPILNLDTPVPAAFGSHTYAWTEAAPLDPQSENETPETPDVENCDMADNDGDGLVDEGCADSDSDGIPDAIDNCPTINNADQADRDRDGLGEVCQFPMVFSLSGNWNGAQTVNLSWSSDATPVLGYAIYRVSGQDLSDTYIGDLYPTTLSENYADTVTFGDTFTYVVRPVNLNGQEGDPVTVSVLVDIEEVLLRDGFEDH